MKLFTDITFHLVVALLFVMFLSFKISAQENNNVAEIEFFGIGGEDNVCTSVPECVDEDLNCSKCIEYLNSKKDEASEKVKTLSSEIAVTDIQIGLTEARIAATQQQIEELQGDIDITEDKIYGLEDDIDGISRALLNRTLALYKYGKIELWHVLLTSESIDNFFTRLKYLKIVQYYDQKNIINAEQSRVSYSNQQDILSSKQDEAENLNLQLESYTNQLEEEKKNKDVLLTVTKNDESRYQRLLAQAQAEVAISFGGGEETFIRNVNKGDIIGFIITGQSGCSTGTHLHFEVQKNGSVEDTNNYLNSSTDYFYWENDEASVGSIYPEGPLSWPLNASVQINQGYGMTPYAQTGAYKGNPHFGIDMSKGPFSAAPVKAVEDGELYGGSFGGCSYGPLIYAKIKHDDGLDTLYLHMNPN